MRFAIVTATLDASRADSCISSWDTTHNLYLVRQASGSARGWYGPRAGGKLWQYWSPGILGVVPAFALGVQRALEDGHDLIACFHDDLEINEQGWDKKVIDFFQRNPRCGLAGFGGGTGLADDDIYQTPYHPMQLARKDFVSNMRHAEAHGRRASTGGDWQWPYQPERVACLDGFSQIGRAEYWKGLTPTGGPWNGTNLFSIMEGWGLIHHMYDGALGCFARRHGNWEVWMLPIACHHFGGRTAVADPRYHQWADQQRPCSDAIAPGTNGVQLITGDQHFWQESHRIVYDQFRDVLPVRI